VLRVGYASGMYMNSGYARLCSRYVHKLWVWQVLEQVSTCIQGMAGCVAGMYLYSGCGRVLSKYVSVLRVWQVM
jgi:hypothetical protein